MRVCTETAAFRVWSGFNVAMALEQRSRVDAR
jgi:hypothetical protein